ncbi:MAG: UDP-N-acetylmuramoyl-tripeptide--D-alanyl-D-alanine ligase [Crocinitomix sp.]|nr:UDP-N-acetylmuramoyl-tripeptide--D-alanyl-D-alanine ligase [Crocinitomix sp.]
MTIETLYQHFRAGTGITTDTRNLKKGALFFALKGDNFNGNKFAAKALQEGCVLAIVDEETDGIDDRIIKVDSVLLTLQDLAKHHRRQFNIPVLGITGSNGKTTTKELVGAVLSKQYKILMTQGNLNNHLGVPFTLLNLDETHELAIIEMGANKPGDIKELVEIAEPTHGIITNVGAAHIEGFGSLQGVIKTKTEMYDFISAKNGTLFINVEDDILIGKLPVGISICSYGEHHGDYQGELVSQNPFVQFSWLTGGYQSKPLNTQLVGKYNFTNFLSAIAIGAYFKVDADDICAAIENYTPSNNRSQVTKTKRNTLIVDCYNANATSMMAALESFVAMEVENKLVILGDMLELGGISLVEHQKIINFVEQHNLKGLLVGEEMEKTKTSLPKFINWNALVTNGKLEDLTNTFVLLKGSRGIQLEELISYL